VGGTRSIHVDVRIVAATHRDLAAMVAQGAFRQDLWFRIGVFPIRLPSLSERPEDIPALANHFAWRAGRRLAGAPLALQPGDVDLLLAYDWPGNVRELAAVIERAAILGDGRRLEIAAALGLPAGRELPGAAPGASQPAQAPREGEALATLDQAIVAHVERALARCRGRIEGPNGAARLLDVNPHTLRSRLRALGVDWARFRAQAP
jgi:transcriptional regulator with GAF, ATPase, and Fis domain